MKNALLVADGILRSSSQPQRGARYGAMTLVLCIVCCSALYGAAMGTFGGVRPWQVLYSAIKAPMLLLLSGAFTIPSAFVLYSLWGLRDDFLKLLQNLLRAQAAMSCVLLSLAPFTLLWYASFTNYPNAVAFNGAMFGIATFVTRKMVYHGCRELIQTARQRKLLWSWFALFAFTGIQMGWMLRPFIGDPARPTTFLRPDGLSNAYEAILRMLL